MKKVKKSKRAYLSYIEETRKHYGILNNVAASATRQAVSITRSQNLPVTYSEGTRIIREYTNGQKVTIGIIDEPSIKVIKGATTKLY